MRGILKLASSGRLLIALQFWWPSVGMETLSVSLTVSQLLKFYNLSSSEKAEEIRAWTDGFPFDMNDAIRRCTGLAIVIRKRYLRMHSEKREGFVSKRYRVKIKRYRDQRWQEFICNQRHLT